MITLTLAVIGPFANPDQVAEPLQLETSTFKKDPLADATSDLFEWTSRIPLPAGVHAGVGGLTEAISELGPARSSVLGEWHARGALVTMAVTQTLETNADEESENLFLETNAVAWLAASGAAFSVDQYIYLQDDADPQH